MKRRVLAWADSPTVNTGFAQVSKNILKALGETGRYDIDMIGINYTGVYQREMFQEQYPYLHALVPALQPQHGDMYGREYVLKTLAGQNPTLLPPYDIFFSIQDHFIMAQKDHASARGLGQAIGIMQKNTLDSPTYRHNAFSWIGYFPVDGALKKPWVEEVIALCDAPVAYCNYGKQEMLKQGIVGLEEKLSVIHHGTNTTDFYPMSDDLKQALRIKYFKDKADADTRIIISVVRNQPRKDVFHTMLAFKELLQVCDNCLLYLHTDPNDPAGGNLFDIARSIGLPLDKVAFPAKFDSSKGVPVTILNELYNCADYYLTTTLGEGWGLPITEAMAAGVPVLAPYITSIQDLLGEQVEAYAYQRGFGFKAGNHPSLWVNYGWQDNEVSRPVSDVGDIVEAFLFAEAHPELKQTIVKNARAWTEQQTWEAIGQQWVALFDRVCSHNDLIRQVAETTTKKYGRNDLCPVCQKKLKKCPHKEAYLKV